MRRELRLVMAEKIPFGPAAAANKAQVGGAEQVMKGHGFSRSIAPHKHPAVAKSKLVRAVIRERRARRQRCDNQQRPDRLVRRCKAARNQRAGCQRAAGERTWREGRVAEGDFDLFNRYTSLLRSELGKDRICAGADVLCRRCYADGAIVTELHARLANISR